MPAAIPILLTPGPLMTSGRTKSAMLRDWGPRDSEFIALNRAVRDRLADLVGGIGTHTTVPMPGSGTLAMEAMLDSFVPHDGKVLVLVNGVYSARMVDMCRYGGRAHVAYETPADTPPDPAEVEARLAADAAITHVAMVDCETTSGILNPLPEVAAAVARQNRGLLLDSVSGLGAVPIDVREAPFDALAASPAKCLEGVPGMSFVIAREAALAACSGNARALSLDLYDQWRSMEQDGRWRFTPPTHVMAALLSALDQLDEEGGVACRAMRYRRNCRLLVEGLRAIGFETLLPDPLQGPVIVTAYAPADPRFDYTRFYGGLRKKGYIIAPGKVVGADTFRIACIGQIGEVEIRGALDAIRRTLSELGVTDCRRAMVPRPAASALTVR
jgi:2-aminoethylphosphonate-pyruvate transaminase